MYTGKIVEESGIEEVFAKPKHPYTQGLIRSVPKLSVVDIAKASRLETIEGTVPSPTALPDGCHFAPRCKFRMDRCVYGEIPIYELEGDVKVRCVLYDEESKDGVDIVKHLAASN
jgi:oligopeptide/dipeptide ABC transporter ATP-binding protein